MGLVHGFGVNDANYSVYKRVGGKQVACKAYTAWISMLARSFSPSYKSKFPTYTVVTVCDEWSSFMAFRDWWLDNYVDGWQLDKDILSDKKIYSPSTCIYIPSWLNKFTTGRMAARGNYPIGVSIDKQTGMFHARCSNPITGRCEFIGSFDSPEKAHSAWLKRKLGITKELKPDMDKISESIYPRVVYIVSMMK